MNVLITGSTGFLGKEVSLALKQKKYNIKYIIRKRFKNKNSDEYTCAIIRI